MNTFKSSTKTYQVDFAGFLLDSDEWDEDFAENMAADVKIPDGLRAEHWEIIHWIRNYFREYGRCPLIYETCRAHSLRLKGLKELFPTGYQRGACRLAGLTYREGFLGYSSFPDSADQITPLEADKVYKIDVRGFLVDPEDWDRQFAIFKAHEMKMKGKLTDQHWEVIDFIRESYRQNHVVPTVYDTCEANGLDVDELERLFPDGYHRGTVKIAGLRLR